MNSLLLSLALSPLFAPANDNAVLDAPVCVACNAHGATVESLCDGCDADMMEHYSTGFYGCDPDAEGACYEAGIDPAKF